jgi:hypothetical protein
MKLVKGWQNFWKWHSTQAMAVAALFPILWENLPSDLKSWVPDTWMPWVVAAVLIGGLLGRLRDQGLDND